MTIIAVKNNVMAADSRISGNYNTLGVKIYRADKALIGFAGEVTQALAFIDWYRDRKRRQPDIANEDDWCALILTSVGIEYWDKSLRPMLQVESIAAIGSGAPFAIAAMDAGKSAVQAAAIACKRVPSCAPPIISERLRIRNPNR